MCTLFSVTIFKPPGTEGSEKPKPLAFWVLFGFGLYWIFGLFYLNEQLGILLVDLADQLSFYFIYICQYFRLSKICRFITYWSLEAVNKNMFNYFMRDKQFEVSLVRVFC